MLEDGRGAEVGRRNALDDRDAFLAAWTNLASWLEEDGEIFAQKWDSIG